LAASARDWLQQAADAIMNGKGELDPTTSRPIGPVVETSLAREPEPVVLDGRFGRIEKLDASRHAADLWQAVSGNDHIWTYMAYGPFVDAAEFLRWLRERTTLSDPYSYVVIDQTGRASGIVALMAIRAAMRVIEVGNIVLSPTLQRTPLATESQYLLASYVFETLGYRRYEWKCDALNAASRRAALRFGFTFEGVFRQHMIVKGHSRDTAWYAMLDSEWPRCKAAFAHWLSPANFDAAQRQKAALAELRALKS
jgi:RimJ/RimL family protein N-acetyltransferase